MLDYVGLLFEPKYDKTRNTMQTVDMHISLYIWLYKEIATVFLWVEGYLVWFSPKEEVAGSTPAASTNRKGAMLVKSNAPFS